MRNREQDMKVLDKEKADREELKEVVAELRGLRTTLNRILFAIIAACIGMVVAIVQAGVIGQ